MTMMSSNIDITDKPSPFSFKTKLRRMLWAVVYHTLFRLSPNPCRRWRAFLLRRFGAKVSSKARVAQSAIITMPWNLTMDDYATLGPNVICYSTGHIHIGRQATVSQYSYLCSATHDHEDKYFTLFSLPITIRDHSWIAADVFVGPGVTIGEGTVVGARSSVYKDLPPWKVCLGNPANSIKDRVIRRNGH